MVYVVWSGMFKPSVGPDVDHIWFLFAFRLLTYLHTFGYGYGIGYGYGSGYWMFPRHVVRFILLWMRSHSCLQRLACMVYVFLADVSKALLVIYMLQLECSTISVELVLHVLCIQDQESWKIQWDISKQLIGGRKTDSKSYNFWCIYYNRKVSSAISYRTILFQRFI